MDVWLCSWICLTVVDLLKKYPTGVTEAVLLTELQSRWKQTGRLVWEGHNSRLEVIDTIHKHKYIAYERVLEARVEEQIAIKNGETRIVKLKDESNSATIEM